MTIEAYDYSEFENIAAKYGVPTLTVIEDYAATAVLSKLVEMDVLEGLVFKGGTAIKRAYYPEARFSIDLDFQTINKEPLKEIAKKYYSRIKKIEYENIGSIFIVNVEEPIVTNRWVQINVEYQSPGFRYLTRVDIENPKSYIEPVERPILSEPFFLFRSLKLLAMPIEDILAEKFATFFDRMDPKDIWDIFFLVKLKGIKVDNIGEKTGISLDQFIKLIDLLTKSDWERLRVQYLPKQFKFYRFEDVISEVKEFAKEHW
mgnify:CR=1 FL=1